MNVTVSGQSSAYCHRRRDEDFQSDRVGFPNQPSPLLTRGPRAWLPHFCWVSLSSSSRRGRFYTVHPGAAVIFNDIVSIEGVVSAASSAFSKYPWWWGRWLLSVVLQLTAPPRSFTQILLYESLNPWEAQLPGRPRSVCLLRAHLSLDDLLPPGFCFIKKFFFTPWIV